MKKWLMLMGLTGLALAAPLPVRVQVQLPAAVTRGQPLKARVTVHNQTGDLLEARGSGCLWSHRILNARGKVVATSARSRCLPFPHGFQVAAHRRYVLPPLLVSTQNLAPGRYRLVGALQVKGQLRSRSFDRLTFSPVEFVVK